MNNNEWISVKDHLPPLDKNVLVCRANCPVVFEARRKKFGRKQLWTNAVWNYQPIEPIEGDGAITHWREMPEAFFSKKENTLIKFSKIPHKNFAIQFYSQGQLNDLIYKLKALGYDYGTGGTDIEEIKLLGIRHFGDLDDCCLSIDRSCSYHPRPYVSIGVDKNNEEIYEFYNIDWRV